MFVEYLSAPFAGLNDTKQTILSADLHVLVVNSIIVCNRTGQNIRFNLQKARMQGEQPVTTFLLNELEVKPYSTVDAIKEIGFNVFLTFQQNPSVIDNLVCYSNGLKQIFDCEVFYSQLNETPSVI